MHTGLSNSSEMAFEALTVGDVIISPKGAKICPITREGDKVFHVHQNYLKCPWGPSTFDKDESNPRQSLEFRTDSELLQTFEALDRWCLDYAYKNSETLFKKQLSLDVIKERYVPVLKHHPSHDALLKTKINMPGLHSSPARIWNMAGEPCPLPTAWRNVEVKPRINVSHLWIMTNQFGLVLQVSDLLIREEQTAFPWGDSMFTD